MCATCLRNMHAAPDKSVTSATLASKAERSLAAMVSSGVVLKATTGARLRAITAPVCAAGVCFDADASRPAATTAALSIAVQACEALEDAEGLQLFKQVGPLGVAWQSGWFWMLTQATVCHTQLHNSSDSSQRNIKQITPTQSPTPPTKHTLLAASFARAHGCCHCVPHCGMACSWRFGCVGPCPRPLCHCGQRVWDGVHAGSSASCAHEQCRALSERDRAS